MQKGQRCSQGNYEESMASVNLIQLKLQYSLGKRWAQPPFDTSGGYKKSPSQNGPVSGSVLQWKMNSGLHDGGVEASD